MADNFDFEVVPLSQSKVFRNHVIPNLQYTHQDFWSLLKKSIELIRQEYGKNFNEFQESSLAVMLMDIWATMGDQLSFKIDQIANEIAIDTVTELANAIRLAKLVGFRPTPPLPAKAMYSVTLNHPLTYDLPLETPIKVAFLPSNGSKKQKIVELFAADHNGNPIFGTPIIIPAQKLQTTNVVGLEGKTGYLQSVGNGQPYQKLSIGTSNVLHGSVLVNIDGVNWKEVDYFTASEPRQEYRIEFDKNWKATIFFGDNYAGLLPSKGSVIKVSYRSGGGVVGNIVSGAINTPININAPNLPHLLTCMVQNYTKAEGGYDGDTIEDIRRKLPLYLKTQGRAVSGFDYKALVDGFATATNGSIGKSTVVLRNAGCAGNILDVYLLARNGTHGLIKANDNLKKELSEYMVMRKMMSETICFRDGEVIDVEVHVNCILDRVNKPQEGKIRERVYARIASLFSLSNWEFGKALKDTDLVKYLADIKELDQIEASFTTVQSIENGQGAVSTIQPRFNEIIRPDNIIVNFGYK